MDAVRQFAKLDIPRIEKIRDLTGVPLFYMVHPEQAMRN